MDHLSNGEVGEDPGQGGTGQDPRQDHLLHRLVVQFHPFSCLAEPMAAKVSLYRIDVDKPLDGKSMIMIFEKPSTRTRISFDLAVKQLGGSSMILNPDGIHYGKGDESLKDTARVLSEYADILMIRTSSHKNLERSADKIESDCLEAIVGAIYEDSGLKSAENFILNFWGILHY